MFKMSLLKIIALGLICAITSISVIGCANSTTQSSTENSSKSSKKESTTESLDEEFWVQFIKDNSKVYNHATTDEIRVAPTDWIDNAPPLEVLEGDENWKITDKDDVLNTTIEPGRIANDKIRYMYGNHYGIDINVYNDSEASMTGKECIENGWYIINHFYSNYAEYSQLNKGADDADNFLLYLENRLGDPNEIYVCDTDDGYDHVECCNFITSDGSTDATMYYYYVYKYTDRTLVNHSQ